MDCEREGCGHPLAFHDPCSKCSCPGYEPGARKERVARLTDVPMPMTTIRDARKLERRFVGTVR